MNKKALATFLAAVSCIAAPVTALAAEESTQEISAVLSMEPTYTVTIPATVNMGNDGTSVDVTAADVENLQEGQKISVTIAGTNYYRNQLVLEADRELVDVNHARTLRYQIINEAGETIETTGQDTATGSEVVSFTGNETKQYQIKPVIVDENRDRLVAGVPYTGSITFGIALAEAE
ncbi:MAG: hypothetical protein KH330_01175 [Clostridiales bacterium]|nr:hypothetical protein [Clostridiales bacterium]